MSTPLCTCAIAIDTNVFEHLFNCELNKCDHISTVLQNLIESDTKLLVDSKSRIPDEYHDRLPRYLDLPERMNETSLLRYWLNKEVWKTVPADSPRLMLAIHNVMKGRERNKDKMFVYVAFHQGENLLSNDFQHVVDGHTRSKQPSIRNELRDKTKHVHPRSKSSQILSSFEAFEKINSNP